MDQDKGYTGQGNIDLDKNNMVKAYKAKGI